MTQMPKITAVIHTLNEEDNIRSCLESVKWVDEIVIIDMYSYDKTVDICREYTERVYFYEQVGFADPARNFGLSKASGDWILSIDADERVPPKLAENLRTLSVKGNEFDAVNIPLIHNMFGKWIDHTFGTTHVVRFFKRGVVHYSGRIHSVHLASDVKGTIYQLPWEREIAIRHFPFKDISQFIFKVKRYAPIEARTLYESKINFKWHNLFIPPLKEFRRRYLKGRGYKDGVYGLTLSLLMAFYRLSIYAKLWGLERFERGGKRQG